MTQWEVWLVRDGQTWRTWLRVEQNEWLDADFTDGPGEKPYSPFKATSLGRVVEDEIELAKDPSNQVKLRDRNAETPH